MASVVQHTYMSPRLTCNCHTEFPDFMYIWSI